MPHDPRRDEEPPGIPQPPPTYASLVTSASTSDAPRAAPQRSTSRGPVQHEYSLFSSRSTPWATLKLLSNVASPRYLPSYFDGQTITGSLDLNLAKPETIQAISITLSGTIVATNASPYTFWELTHDLWSSDMEDTSSRPSSSAQESSQFSRYVLGRGKNASKLVGTYSWPFSVTMPSTCSVSLRSKQPPVILRLPPSFSEKGAAQFINYEMNVRIRRGPLRIDSKLGTQFGFAPRVRPPAPSLLRRLAYHENSPLLGPEADPDGWEIFPSIHIHGKVFGVRSIDAICSFAFALPLSYARGSPIPCSLTVVCDDAQAVDLLFTPSSISVHLIREVLYDTEGRSRVNWDFGPPSVESSPSDLSVYVSVSTPFNPRSLLPSLLSRTSTGTSTSTSAGPSSPPSSLPSSKSSKVKEQIVTPKLALRSARKPVACAVWWPNRESGLVGQRRMDGEILLPKDLVPSFAFRGFSVKYSIALLPFQAPGFEPVNRELVLLARVDVGTLHAQGPMPRTYAPPGSQAQLEAYQDGVQQPMVWGLYNTYAGTRE